MIEYPSLKELVQGRVAKFRFYRNGVLYYSVDLPDGRRCRFAVPILDVGDASMLDEDNAMLYMRWIRKAIESEELEVIEAP